MFPDLKGFDVVFHVFLDVGMVCSKGSKNIESMGLVTKCQLFGRLNHGGNDSNRFESGRFSTSLVCEHETAKDKPSTAVAVLTRFFT